MKKLFITNRDASNSNTFSVDGGEGSDYINAGPGAVHAAGNELQVCLTPYVQRSETTTDSPLLEGIELSGKFVVEINGQVVPFMFTEDQLAQYFDGTRNVPGQQGAIRITMTQQELTGLLTNLGFAGNGDGILMRHVNLDVEGVASNAIQYIHIDGGDSTPNDWVNVPGTVQAGTVDKFDVVILNNSVNYEYSGFVRNNELTLIYTGKYVNGSPSPTVVSTPGITNIAAMGFDEQNKLIYVARDESFGSTITVYSANEDNTAITEKQSFASDKRVVGISVQSWGTLGATVNNLLLQMVDGEGKVAFKVIKATHNGGGLITYADFNLTPLNGLVLTAYTDGIPNYVTYWLTETDAFIKVGSQHILVSFDETTNESTIREITTLGNIDDYVSLDLQWSGVGNFVTFNYELNKAKRYNFNTATKDFELLESDISLPASIELDSLVRNCWVSSANKIAFKIFTGPGLGYETKIVRFAISGEDPLTGTTTVVDYNTADSSVVVVN